MPLTEFQRNVLRLLAANRTPESFVAGGTMINANPDSPRYSDDVDIFHDAAESVALAADADARVLAGAAFSVTWLVSRPEFQRALISRDGQELRLEWTQDSAYRFFPVQRDAEYGWRLHLADLATNKVLALAGRWEVRDFVDTLYLDRSFASLGLLAWAAAGKDPGLTPALIIEQANRFNRLRPEDFLAALGPEDLNFVKMKARWRDCVAAAQELVAVLPPTETGVFYLDEHHQPVDPRFTPVARLHRASLGGALPRVNGGTLPLPDRLEREAEKQVRRFYPGATGGDHGLTPTD